VEEWTSSLYKDYPYKADDGRENMSASGVRVVRGGSFLSDWSDSRATLRISAVPSSAYQSLGIRCGVGGVAFPISLK